MDKENESVRERLLSHLPQATNVAAYREGIDALMAKEEKSLSTFRWTNKVLIICAMVLGVWALRWADTHQGLAAIHLASGAAVIFLFAASERVVLYVRRYQIDVLKEVKQTQVQLLELQASLEHDRSGRAADQ